MTKKETNLSGTLSEAVSVATSVAYTRQEIQKLKTEFVSLLEKKTAEVIVEQVPGPVGPRGAIGATGAQGPKGDKGDRGDVGERGEKGEVGPQGNMGLDGPRGLKGDKGDKGEQGQVGPQGEQGIQGVAGERGPQGLKGDRGEDGKNGLDGKDGEAGAIGPVGPVGPQGVQGGQGPKGDKGERGRDGQQGIAGPAGPQGEIGPQGIQGVAGKDGKDGDIKPVEEKFQKFIENVQKDVSAFKTKVNAAILKSGPNDAWKATGSGEVNLRYLDDVDRDSITDGYVLSYDEALKKFVFVEQSGGAGGGTVDTLARARANSAWYTANLAYVTANSAWATANSALNQQSGDIDPFARSQANTALDLANSAFAKANTGGAAGTDNLARSIANSAFSTANASGILAQSAYDYANTIVVPSLSGYAVNTTVNLIWSTANSAFSTANTATSLAQAAYNYANTIVSDTQVDPFARSQANSAFNKANTANSIANSAFAKANTGTSQLVNGSSTLSLSANGTVIFPEGYLSIVPNGANPYISNRTDNGLGLAAGSSIQIRQSVADNYGISIDSSTINTVGTNTLGDGSNIDVNGSKIILSKYTYTSDVGSNLTTQNKIEINNNEILIGRYLSNTLNGNTATQFNGLTFTTQSNTLTVPGPISGLGNSKLDFTTYGSNTAYLTTTSDDSTALYMGLTSAELYANTTVQIRTNTAGVSKNWTFGEDGTLTFPDNTVQTTAPTNIDSYARNTANTANNQAASAFSKANTATTLAQAAYNFANTIVSDTQIDPLARSIANSAFAKANTSVTYNQNLNTSNTVSFAGVTVTGNTTVQHVVPSANVTYDLGTPTARFRDLYLSGNTINLGGAQVSANGATINLPAQTKVGNKNLTFEDISTITLDTAISSSDSGLNIFKTTRFKDLQLSSVSGNTINSVSNKTFASASSITEERFNTTMVCDNTADILITLPSANSVTVGFNITITKLNVGDITVENAPETNDVIRYAGWKFDTLKTIYMEERTLSEFENTRLNGIPNLYSYPVSEFDGKYTFKYTYIGNSSYMLSI